MNAQDVRQLKPFLVNAKTAAQLCGVGLSLWYELAATGQIPQAVKLNSRKLWVYEELQEWCRNGCPSRDSAEWQKIKGGQ